MRRLSWMFAAIALPVLVSAADAGDAPVAKSPSSDQQIADELAARMRTSGQLRDYAIEIHSDAGCVTLSGRVTNENQRIAALELARGHFGVMTVRDRIDVGGLQLVQGELRAADAVRVQANADGGQVIEPAPIHTFVGGVAPFADAPVIPPYAWPGYTPYNNFASMAYQTQYPSGAWPFIGPPHPYPMIPSGWRHVSLRWHHGYWWLKFHSH